MTNREKFIQYLEEEKRYIEQEIAKELEKNVVKQSAKNIGSKFSIQKNYIAINNQIEEKTKRYSA